MVSILALAILLFSCLTSAYAENHVAAVRKAIEHSTLDQRGTEPFHLKAVIAPSFERDRESHRTGTVEIWWASPEQWRRELSTDGLHLTEISNNGRQWQRTEGNYLPEWLRETAVALIRPVPDIERLLGNIKAAEVTNSREGTHFSWMEFSTDGSTRKAMGAGLMISSNSGLLEYGSGFGWSFNNKNYGSFHRLLIARQVSGGTLGPEVTAKVTTLEDLGSVSASLFDTRQQGGDSNPLRTVLADEVALRGGLLPMAPPVWPALKDGPLEGVFTTEVVVDREGKVREIGTFVSDNPGLQEAANAYMLSMRFRPYIVDGRTVQAYSRLTFSFKTTRPAGMEVFDSARNYFERGRRLTSAGGRSNATPYVLHATFEAGSQSGVKTGEYTDTWYSDAHWCRVAVFDGSRFSRCRAGDKWYMDSQGSGTGVLQLVLKAIEPIPTIDTFVESDWRISRKDIGGYSFIQIATGHESDEGVLDPQSRGLWFYTDGVVYKAHFRGVDTVYSKFEEFHGCRIAHQVDVTAEGKLAIRIRVSSVEALQGSDAPKPPGHEWKRQFTDEAR
jgi:hypothetical protein